MDKYRLLITGKNKAVIDDFFNHTGNEFETVSTSDRMDDINRHLDFFTPQVMVLALYDESRDDVFKFTELKRRLAKEEIVLVIIGEKEDCDIFEKVTFHMADYIIHRPVDVSEIRNRIVNYLEEIEKQKEEDREIQLALEALREQQRRKHVLVIDDDPLMLKLIKEYLHRIMMLLRRSAARLHTNFSRIKQPILFCSIMRCRLTTGQWFWKPFVRIVN